MSTEAEEPVYKPVPSDPSVRRFARFFRTYGFSLGLVVAALPFGLQKTNFLDYYKSTGGYLTFVASLVSFLCVAAVFGARQHIGQKVFPARRTISFKSNFARIVHSTIIPTICGILSIAFLIFYTIVLSFSVDDVAVNAAYLPDPRRTSIHEELVNQKNKYNGKYVSDFTGRAEGQLLAKLGEDYRVVGQIGGGVYDVNGLPGESVIRLSKPAYDSILAETAPDQISYQFFLFAFYVSAFATASVSLVWFGVVEYLQAELAITDADLIRRPYRVAEPK
jgi:hypothetical protein